MKKIQVCFLLLLQIITMTGCNIFFQKHKDSFYNDTGTDHSEKLPLMDPYYLIHISDEHSWHMPIKGNFTTKYYYVTNDLMDVKKVSVMDGIIMIYTAHPLTLTNQNLEKVALHWFILIPKNGNSEIGFDNEADFLDYLQTLGIAEPNWVDPQIAYDKFYKTGCFDWIPDCK